MAAEVVKLPVIDLSSPDRISSANSIRQACMEYGFFYVVNHGVKEELLSKVFDESRKFFSLHMDEKMKLLRKEHRGYSPLYAENLDPSACSKGDSKESFYIGPLERSDLNQWPSEVVLSARKFQKFSHLGGPQWLLTITKFSFQHFHGCTYPSFLRILDMKKWLNGSVGKRLISLIALSLKLDEDYFEKIGALDAPEGFLRLLRYPGQLGDSEEELYGAYSHSDYGTINLLATDGVPGLQVCKEKFKQPRTWEDVVYLNGAFIVNIGDMMERWTNCLFRSTLHRVMPTGRERYSVAFFLDPNPDCIVQCLESCCSESCPPRFPPICSGDYMKERFKISYGLG